MMKKGALLAAGMLLILAAACDKKSQVVGMWKVEPAATSANNPGDAMRGATMNLWTQNMKVEFTGEGKVRFTNFQGESTGTYVLNGDEVTIDFNSFAPTPKLKLKLTDGKLRQVTDFQSDVALVLVRE